MVPDDTNKLQDVFVVEVDSGRVLRASGGEAGFQGNGDSPITQGEKIAISHDGRLVAFSSNAKNLGGKILIKDLQTGRLIKVAEDVESAVGQPAMSPNGGFVLFGSNRQLDSRFRSSGVFAVAAPRN
jgi:Tol biopolymer transport system component